MCGDMPARPSFGGRIAVMFPPASAEPVSSTASPSSSSSNIGTFTLLFNNDSTGTKAILKANKQTLRTLQEHKRIDLRIEKYGDLSSLTTLPQPLHSFSLSTENTKTEFDLPEKLDLGVSRTGVVGRQITIRPTGSDVVLGTGIVGWN